MRYKTKGIDELDTFCFCQSEQVQYDGILYRETLSTTAGSAGIRINKIETLTV